MLTSTHLAELLKSAIDPDIARLNFQTLTGNTPYNSLLYSDKLERTNSGRLAAWLLNRYRHVEEGGWWASGLDPLDNWQPMSWGQFKPDKARVDSSRKAIKYEAPPQTSTRAYFLKVTFAIGLKTAQKFGQEEEYGERILQAYTRNQAAKQGAKAKRRGFGTSAKITRCGNPGRTQIHSRTGGVASNTCSVPTRWLEAVEDASFWTWVLGTPKIPLVLTEGSKKCAALLSAGYVAIALPGVTGGARKPKDEYGNEIGKSYLIPELEAITAVGRGIFIAFDQDCKHKTIRDVSKQIGNLSRLLQQKGCKVWIVKWEPSQGKGCDDLIANHGSEAFDKVFAKALTYESWQVRSYGGLTYAPSLTLDQKYLGDISTSIPKDTRLICLKSPKGSGKTQSLKQIVEQAHSQGRRVLLLSHRVQLCQALCDRLKLRSVYEALEMRSEGNAAAVTLEISVNGFGLCVDSLHPKSQAHFSAVGWEDADIVIDEATQVLWHTLSSSTCKGDRVAILRELKTLLGNALSPETRGRVILSDADLSDTAIDFVKSVAHQPNLEPWLCLNNWKPEPGQGCQIHNYKGPKEEWLLALEHHIANGGKPLICLDSQKLKGKFSTSSLEKWLAQKFPEKRILRIDSQTLQLQDHPAFGCMCSLDKVIASYDIVLCSPTLETGISLDIKAHFTSVWGLFQGCLPANSVRQALARLREPVPRHVWIAPYGFGGIGNGETSVKALLDSQNKVVKVNLHLIFDASIDEGDIDTDFITGAKECWAKMAVQVNAGLVKYRNSIVEELAGEGHQIIDGKYDFGIDPQLDAEQQFESEKRFIKQVREEMTLKRDANQQEYGERVAAASSLSKEQARTLETARSLKTEVEQLQLRKHQLHDKYGGVEVTPELHIKDQAGLYSQLRLHYYITMGRPYLKVRDRSKRDSLTDQSQGWMPDLNKTLLSAHVCVQEKLDFVSLLERKKDGEWRNDDPDLIAFAEKAFPYRKDIKDVLGFTLDPGGDDPDDQPDTPIQVVTKFLKKLGLSLQCLRKEGGKGQQVRVYQLDGLKDGRHEIFTQWLKRDEVTSAKAVESGFVSSSDTVVTAGNKNTNTPRDYQSDTTDSIVSQEKPEETPPLNKRAEEGWFVGQRVKAWFGMGRCWCEGSIQSVEINASNCFKAVVKLANEATQYVWDASELVAL